MEHHNNNRHKVNFFWVLVALIVSISMAYASGVKAKTVRDLNQEIALEKVQQSLDFPVLEHWDAGNGENAIWVDPRQSLSTINIPDVAFDTPKYKLHLDPFQPGTHMISPQRVYRGVAKIELYSWDW